MSLSPVCYTWRSEGSHVGSCGRAQGWGQRAGERPCRSAAHIWPLGLGWIQHSEQTRGTLLVLSLVTLEDRSSQGRFYFIYLIFEVYLFILRETDTV